MVKYLIIGIDKIENMTDYIIHKAIQCARKVFKKYLCDNTQKKNFFAILERLTTIESGFTHTFCIDNTNDVT